MNRRRRRRRNEASTNRKTRPAGKLAIIMAEVIKTEPLIYNQVSGSLNKSNPMYKLESVLRTCYQEYQIMLSRLPYLCYQDYQIMLSRLPLLFWNQSFDATKKASNPLLFKLKKPQAT